MVRRDTQSAAEIFSRCAGAIVLPFLFQHAVQGWCPPVPVFRWLGVRTRQEIDEEKYALKVLRGDFDRAATLPTAEVALESVKS